MNEQFTFFWKSRSPFSQWFQGAPFVLHGITFRDAETYMMWCKDHTFGGFKEQEILASTKPSQAKDLGRMVPHFNRKVWDAVAKQHVFRGNLAKFSQNPLVAKELLATVGTTLVEASPHDTIWGIGLSEDDVLALDRSTWKGTNWLGEVLTEVRDTMLLIRAGTNG